MARRFTHGGRLDTRDRGPFVTCDLHTRTVLDAITGSEYAHDWLSQTASDIYRIRKDHAEAECYDAGFDGGEFSGPAHAEQEAVETDRAEAHFFNYTGTTFSHAVRCRISEKTAHRLGF